MMNLRGAVAAFFAFCLTSCTAFPFAGGPDDGYVGCDDVDACSITLDEEGNIAGSFNGFLGPYDVTVTSIASSTLPAYANLEVKSYEVVGSASWFGAPLRLTAGAIGICDVGVTADGLACTGPNGDTKSDVLVFRPGIIDGNGFGHTIIDFLSETAGPFNFQTEFNVLEVVGSSGSNGATYRTGETGFYPNGVICPGDPGCTPAFERMTYYITSDCSAEKNTITAFTLINAPIATPIGPLGNIDYTAPLAVTKLNIIAEFSECSDNPIDSVELTFDNEPSRCEKDSTYAAFGNAPDSSTYVSKTFSVGTHQIKATPYTGPACNGFPGTPLTQTFTVTGCTVSYKVYNAKIDTLIGPIATSGPATTFTNPPCQINIEAVVSCGSLSFTTVTLELLSGTAVVKSRTETAAPYFLFGDTISPPNILSGSIGAGSYSIRVKIAGITHPAVPFTLSGACTT